MLPSGHTGHLNMFRMYFSCDGEDDCGDWSDEDVETICKNSVCKEDQFR